MVRVLRKMRQKNSESTSRAKLSSPTHLLAQMPSSGLKFLKAMITPYMGR